SPWTENQAWVNTGDCAQAIDKNYFRLKGRRDGVIKIEDKRISLLALETVLTEHTLIASAKLLVLPQARQTIAAACVLSNAGREILQQQGKNTLQTILRKHLAQHYELITLPRRWRFVDALPVNAIGKHDWQSLADLFNKPGEQPACLSLPDIVQSERNGNSLRLSFTVTDEIKWFTGHFPNKPILPGVVQIDWAIHFAQAHFGSSSGFQRMEKIKFQNLIVPGQKLNLVLEQKPDNTRIAFRYEYDEQTFSSGIVKLGEDS
ncbi:MAG TPA: AMP-binding protein, partial [Gammaproteobacteria bacterium]|nr:AMP-binding protein [Gammaproteobacteria bacterium]